MIERVCIRMNSIEKAIQQMNNGQVEEALEILKEYDITATDDEKFMIADLYYEWGFLEQAIVQLKGLLEAYPQEGQIITNLAEMYVELEKDDLAIDLLNQIEKKDPFYLETLLQLADLYQAQGLFEVSEQKLLEAKQIAPDEKIIDFALGELLFSIGQYSRAIPFYEKIVPTFTEINSIVINERLAESYALTGLYEKALAYYEELNSENPDTLFKYGFTALQQDRNDIAIHVWKKLIEIDPYYHTVYQELAYAMKEEGLIEEAFPVVKQGLAIDEFNKELFYLAGELALLQQEREEAIHYLEEAIALDIDYQEAILLLVSIYKEEQKHSKIIDVITNVIQDGASDPIYDWELARAYQEEEMYKEALQSFNKASDHLSHDSDFLKEYGYFLTEEGLISDAIKMLEKYIVHEPLDEETIAFVERLKFSNTE